MAAKVHARECFHRTALDYAVLGGHLEVVRLLAPFPIPNPDGTAPGFETHGEYLGLALIESVQSGNKEISEYLLSSGADVNFLSSRYSAPTPLHYAVDTGNVEMVQLLLKNGANPNLHDTYEIPPLFKAYAIEVAEALLDAGANIHAQDEESCNVLTYIDGDANLLHFLLERGSDPNHEDIYQRTPLHHACQGDLGKGSVELLLKFGATTAEKADWMGRTPVGIAMANHNAGTVKVLEPLVQSPSLKGRIAAWWEEYST
ncbi:ankyrin repeat-containing domain protein [Mycena sanguinolenta]|nr:ankyrin repeat-containing domain protein [Mycena sanguinolenta]